MEVRQFDFLPAAPAAKLLPNVLLCSPLDNIAEAERGILSAGHPRIFIHFAQALHPGEVTLVSLFTASEQTREVAVTT